jgi:Na+/H+ antiporter NhaB
VLPNQAVPELISGLLLLILRNIYSVVLTAFLLFPYSDVLQGAATLLSICMCQMIAFFNKLLEALTVYHDCALRSEAEYFELNENTVKSNHKYIGKEYFVYNELHVSAQKGHHQALYKNKDIKRR